MKDSTRKIYLSKINKLRKEIYDSNTTNISILNNYKKNNKWINEQNYKISTLKSWYIALFSLSKNEKNVNDKALEFYHENMIKLRNKNNKEIKKNIKSKKQSEEWVDYEELKKIPTLLKNILSSINEKENKKKYYRTYTDYVIISLYTLIPPLRLDYFKMYIFDKEQLRYYPRYMEINKKKKQIKIHLNEFKNVNKIGKQVIEINNKELINIIINYINFKEKNNYKTELLLYSITNKGEEVEFTSNTFGRKVERIFQKYIGKKITVGLVRHLYESWLLKQPWYQNMNLNDREKEHLKALHTLSTGMQYMKIDKNKKIREISKEEAEKILLDYGYKIKN